MWGVLHSGVVRWRGRVIAAAGWVSAAAFVTIFVLNLANITGRQFNSGMVWVSDLSELLFAWMIMLGAAAAYGRNDHIVAGFLVEWFPALAQRVVAFGVRGIELVLGFVLLVAGLQVATTRMDVPYVQLGVPTGWTFLAIPALGALLLLLGLSRIPAPPTAPDQPAATSGTRTDAASRREETP
ncbi:TRAP transporter small permease subunit [Spiractinospora alimapuensis]|uniref:TRAP transporter small permease n=1 Tax=Spiractinospora alimapuensis TaxID=2820884 RepID=UPI001F325853|nr:TRAP transporter small permease subunit [Spiractinospora alimapuensis]QVQ53507.1 TRAP transporter small permease subunit [Spiractinospora alimapuensis]